MKKRSKLDLSSSAKNEKAQAAGFSSKAEQDPAAAAKSKTTGRRASTTGRQYSAAGATIAQQPSRAIILTAVAVVAVVAVSLFVLKKR